MFEKKIQMQDFRENYERTCVTSYEVFNFYIMCNFYLGKFIVFIKNSWNMVIFLKWTVKYF